MDESENFYHERFTIRQSSTACTMSSLYKFVEKVWPRESGCVYDNDDGGKQLAVFLVYTVYSKGRRIHTKRFFFLSIYSIYVSNVLRSTEPAISRYRIKTKVLFHWLEDWHSRPNPQHMLITFTDNLERQTWVVRSSESILYLEFYITGLILL